MRGLALELFFSFLFYLVIYYLDMYCDWDVLVGDLVEIDADEKSFQSASDFRFGKQNDSQDKSFSDVQKDQCNYSKFYD